MIPIDSELSDNIISNRPAKVNTFFIHKHLFLIFICDIFVKDRNLEKEPPPIDILLLFPYNMSR